MKKAQDFTIKYLQILEDTLHVENVDEGKPTFFPSRVNQFTFRKLSNEVNDLIRSTELIDAVYDMESSCRDTDNIFTTGVGYCEEDFSNFVKLGLLLGNKVVLWEALLPSILNNNKGVDLNLLGRYLYSVLSLKKLAQAGGLIFLPHPTIWNDRTKYYLNSISDIKGVSNEFIGFINAWSLLQDGFRLHPYLMAPVNSNTYKLHEQFLNSEPLFPKEKLDLHADLYDFIRYDKFDFLPDSKIHDFYNVINKDKNRFKEFKSKMYQKIQKPDHLTESEKKQYLENIFQEMHNEIKSQNKNIFKNQINKSTMIGGAIGTVGSLVAATISPESTVAIISLFSGVFSASSSLLSLYNSLKKKPNINIVYQVFNEIKDKTEINKLNEELINARKQKYNLI